MQADAGNFTASFQGYLARSDQACCNCRRRWGSPPRRPPAEAVVVVHLRPLLPLLRPRLLLPCQTALLWIPPGTPFDLLSTVAKTAPITLSVEPSETTRQHAEYLKVNQALRRTNIGDDNSRRGGYTAYLLRFPVSILPGAKRFVVTGPDQPAGESRNRRQSSARLVLWFRIADLIAVTEPWIMKNWELPVASAPCPRWRRREELSSGLPRIAEFSALCSTHR